MTQPRCSYPKCDRVIVYRKKTFRWVHITPGADHAPVPPSARLRDDHVAHEEGDARTRW